MNERIGGKTLSWEEIRTFLVRRKWLRDREQTIDAETFDLIRDRKVVGNEILLRELSVFIEGYRWGKP